MTAPVVQKLTEPVADDLDTSTFAARARTNFLEVNPVLNSFQDALEWVDGQAANVNNQAGAAASNASAASLSAADAAVHAAAAAQTSTAANWVSGTTYAVNDVRRSLADGLPYRRTTAGAGTTDPASDQTNWELEFLNIATGLPTIRPTLLLDPVNSGVVDARIVCTRAGDTATYWDEFGVLRTTPANTLRIDHDPLTGERLGYLVEGAATNTALHALAPLNWQNRVGVSVEGGYLNVDNNLTAIRLIEDTSNGPHQIGSFNNSFVVAGTTYTATKIVKAGPRSQVQLVLSSSGLWPESINPGATFDLLSFTVIANSSNATPKIKRLSGDKAEISVTATCAVSGSSSGILQIRNGVSTVYSGNGSSYLEVFAEQFEAGSSPTSIIPTAGSAVTRAADVPVISGADFASFYNQAEGTFVVEAISYNYGFGSASCPLHVSNGTTLTGHYIGQWLSNNSKRVILSNVNNSNQVDFVFSSFPLGNWVTTSVSYRKDDYKGTHNSGVVLSDTLADVPSVDRLHIGCTSSGAQHINGHIRRIAYYPRAVSAAELQALSRI